MVTPMIKGIPVPPEQARRPRSASVPSRRTARWARELAKLLTESSVRYDFRAVPWRDDEGSSYIVERRVRLGGHWHFVGWIEDLIADGRGGYACYGSTLT